MFAGGLARFGFVTELLSMPVRLGYLMGIAVTVIVAQLPKLFGFSVDAESFIRGDCASSSRDSTRPTRPRSRSASRSLALILGLRRVAPKVPGVFVAVVGATAAVAVLGLADQVPVVGDVPAGLPAFGVPDVSFEDFKTLIPAAVGIAFVAFADTSVLSRSYAGRLRQEVDQNQELAVLGVANIATGFFQGFPISTSSSRTAVAEDIGARSQVTGLDGAARPGVAADRRNRARARPAAVDARGHRDRRRPGPDRHRAARGGCAAGDGRSSLLAMAAFAGVAVLGVLWGVGIAIALSLLNFIRRAWRPHDAVLGRVDNLKGYHDTERYPDARHIPGLVLYRFDAPLFFANADYFRERVRALARARRRRWIVVAAEPITDIDATAGETLRGLIDELDADGIELAFAELKDPVRDRLRRYGIDDAIGDASVLPDARASPWPPTLARPASTGSTGRIAAPSRVCTIREVQDMGHRRGRVRMGVARTQPARSGCRAQMRRSCRKGAVGGAVPGAGRPAGLPRGGLAPGA